MAPVPIPAFADNYIWRLPAQSGRGTLLVDPGDAAPVLAAASAGGWRPDAVLLTHHHDDHIQAVPDIVAATGAEVWGNGADFDNATIIHLAAQNGWRPPWSYRTNRCFRTIRNIKGVDELDVNFKGVEHNALDDARYQAERLIRINNAFGGIFL